MRYDRSSMAWGMVEWKMNAVDYIAKSHTTVSMEVFAKTDNAMPNETKETTKRHQETGLDLVSAHMTIKWHIATVI